MFAASPTNQAIDIVVEMIANVARGLVRIAFVLDCDDAIVVRLSEPASGIGDRSRCGLLAASCEKSDEQQSEGKVFHTAPMMKLEIRLFWSKFTALTIAPATHN